MRSVGLDLTLWTARLEQILGADYFKQLGESADLGAAQSDTRATPAAFLLPERESGGPNSIDSGVRQRVAVETGVVLAVRNYRGSRGEAGNQAMRTVRMDVGNALLNWQPDDAADPVEYSRGVIVAFNKSTLWWRDTYRTSYYVRKV